MDEGTRFAILDSDVSEAGGDRGRSRGLVVDTATREREDAEQHPDRKGLVQGMGHLGIFLP